MNKISRTQTTAATALFLATTCIAGCAGNPRPIIDTRDLDTTRYEADLAECSALGHEAEVAGGVLRGAVFGAAVGATFGAVFGDAGTGAELGAITGASDSALGNELSRQSVIKECMRGRGYRVLN
jgi:outer membrane lipoprotein SlyB